MSVQRLVHLFCDADDCDAEWVGADQRVQPVRSEARSNGWVFHGAFGGRTGGPAVDLCPRHARTYLEDPS